MVKLVNKDTADIIDQSALSTLDTTQLMEFINIQNELKDRVIANPLKYFWPHQKNCDGTGENCDKAFIIFKDIHGKEFTIHGCPQYKFLSSLKSTKCFMGANRSGKSTAGVYELLVHAAGQYPSWWAGRRWDRAIKGRIFAEGFTKGVSVITEKIREWIPKECIANVNKNSLGAEISWHIKHKSGGVSHFDILSYEQDSSSAEGASHDILLFDEPPPRNMYIAATRGLIDTDGISLFTLTPLKEPWLFDEIYSSKDDNVLNVMADMYHNLQRYNPLTRRIVGLTVPAIQRYEQKLTEEEDETRMHGTPRYLAGRIWKEWDRDVHTFDRLKQWPSSKIGESGYPPRHWPRALIIDPHDRNPQTLIWVAMDETGESWFYREGWLKDATIEDTVSFIRQVELEARERVGLRVLDPNFGPKRYANTGNTVRDEFEQAGRKLNYPVRFTFGDDHVEIGHKAVALALKFDKSKPLGLLNHPMWHVASDLKNCIYQVEHYIWDEYKLSDRDPKEKPKDLNKHFPDTWRYYALSGMKWNQPKMSEGRGSFYGVGAKR